jgi:hypothetical protein
LTQLSVAAKLWAGAILLLRRIITCVVLVALVGIYAMPLAAAFSPNAMDCCAAGMCPRPGRSLAHHHAINQQQSHRDAVDCGMGSQSGSLRKCEMGACSTEKNNAVNEGMFVMSTPMRVLRSAAQVPVLVAAAQAERVVSQIPETPPPRTSLS